MVLSAKWKLKRGRNVIAQPLSISGTPVTTATQNVTYIGFSVTGAGGTPPYTYSIASGAYPSGILLDPVTGASFGIPTVSGTFSNIVLRVTDNLGTTRDLAPFTLEVAEATGTPSEDIEARLHLTSGARGWIETDFLPEYGNLWLGPPGTYATDQLATTTLDFFNKVNALTLTQHHRIRLQTAGDFTTATTSGFVIRARDFKANGGSLTVEAESGTGPVISAPMTIQGATNILIKNCTFSRAGVVNRSSSRPAWSNVIFQDCRFGDTYTNTTPLPVLSRQNGVTASNVEEVQFINCRFNGVDTGIKPQATRRIKVLNCDFQQLLGDAISCTASSIAVNGENINTRYPTDQNVYIWVRGNTVQNLTDFTVASNPPHTDFVQVGYYNNSTGETDTCGTKYLFEFNTFYGERDHTYAGTGTQGFYFDDTQIQIQGCSHSNLIVMSAYAAASSFGRGTVDSFTYAERNHFVRTAKLEPTNDAISWVFAGGEPTSPATSTMRSTKNIAALFFESGTNVDLISTGDVVANPAKNKLGTSEDYNSRFKGTFTTDSEGRTTYTFNDTGAYTKTQLQNAIWAVFEPEDALGDVGAPDPSLWPIT